MPLGPENPLPFRVGGGPTPVQRVVTVLRRAMGQGGTAAREDGIEGLWFRSLAKGLVAGSSAKRRALLQTQPQLATDGLPYYERLLGLPPSDAPEASRRDEVVPRYTQPTRRSIPEVAEALAAIDPRFEVLSQDRETTATTTDGRMFAPHSFTVETDYGRPHTALPNYSEEFVVYVLFDLGNGVQPNEDERRLLALAADRLRTWLGSWVTYQIATHRGFVADISRADLTALGG